MPENKKPVKQVSVYTGTDWDTYDIGANAENITLSSINIGDNVQNAFTELIGSNSLGNNQAVITDSQGRITTSNISVNSLENLDNTTVIENQGVLDNNASIKKLKQKNTDNIILPETKTSAVYMPDNITTLDRYLGNTDISTSGKSTISEIIGGNDISSIEDGTITGAIGNTSLTSIGDGTITGAIDSLNTNLFQNKILWQSPTGLYLNASQTVTLSEGISKQPNGIVLIWSAYTGDTDNNYRWNCNFIPKIICSITNYSGGYACPIGDNAYIYAGCKYIYITSDTTLTGHDYNQSFERTASSITVNNQRFALRYVIGI